MHIRDTTTGYGIVSRALHWLMAFAIFFLFGLGAWMVTLTYDSPYYNSGPDLHRSLGILVAVALVARFLWRLVSIHPSEGELSPAERRASRLVHWGFYPLILALAASGYLITTSEGSGVDVFGLFNVPAAVVSKGLSDTSGYIHKILAYATLALALVHAAAAFKHHFVDRSSILRRMWSGPPRTKEHTS